MGPDIDSLTLWFNQPMSNLILLRGGGDLASGVALRLHHAGLNIVIAELPQPLAVRRAVSRPSSEMIGHVRASRGWIVNSTSRPAAVT